MRYPVLLKGFVLLTALTVAACGQSSALKELDAELNQIEADSKAKFDRIEFEGEAKMNLLTLRGVHSAFKVTSPTFSDELDPLDPEAMKPEDKHYKYEVVSADEKSVKITATAKSDTLSSFALMVAAVQEPDGTKSTEGLICKTDEPAQTPPDMIDISDCPEGSSPD